MATEISGIKLYFTPSQFPEQEIKEITATVYISATENTYETASTEIAVHYLKSDLQDLTLNEVLAHVLNQAKQTLERDIADFPAL